MTQFLQVTLSLPRHLGHGLRGQARDGRLVLLGRLASLIALLGFALWGATLTYRTGVAVRHATGLSNAFKCPFENSPSSLPLVAEARGLPLPLAVSATSQTRTKAAHYTIGAEGSLERKHRLELG